jgi:hypothetical protein
LLRRRMEGDPTMKWKHIQLVGIFGLLCGAGVCALNELYVQNLWLAVSGGVLLGSHAVIEILATFGRLKNPMFHN